MDSSEVSSFAIILSWAWKAFIALLVIGNLKNIPFFWHLRIVKGYRQCLKSNRPKRAPQPSQLFQPMIMASHSPMMELDYNLHKSNSTYFSDIDIARSHLCCTLFANAVDKVRHAPIQGLGDGAEGLLGLALGSVACSFKREIPAYSNYEIWTRILSWDDKWLYLVSHFVRKDRVTPKSFTLYPGQRIRKARSFDGVPKDAVMASAISKCVWKKGRRSVPPEDMLALAGLLPLRPGGVTADRLEPGVPGPTSLLGLAEGYLDIPFRGADFLENAWHAVEEKFFPGDFVTLDNTNEKAEIQEWTWEQMEAERVRGLDIAKSLAELSQVDEAFTGEGAALGWQSDLW